METVTSSTAICAKFNELETFQYSILEQSYFRILKGKYNALNIHWYLEMWNTYMELDEHILKPSTKKHINTLGERQ